MGFTGAHVLYTFDVFILALYLLFHGCALLKYTCKQHITEGKKAEITHMLLYQRMKMFPDKNIWCYARDQND